MHQAHATAYSLHSHPFSTESNLAERTRAGLSFINEEVPCTQEALIRRQVEAYAADPSAGASKGQSSIQIRRDWKAKEKQLQVTPHLKFVVWLMSIFEGLMSAGT